MQRVPYLKSSIFERFEEIIFGFSLKGYDYNFSPYGFNISFSVGDNPELVKTNRSLFFNQLGIKETQLCYIKQEHTDIIAYAAEPINYGIADAIITDKRGLALTVTVADCVPIFLYDKKRKIIAAIHSGWRGTAKKIFAKTLQKLRQEFKISSGDLYAYIGPSISKDHYEVSEDVAKEFDIKYLYPTRTGKYYLDLKTANFDMAVNFGIPIEQIQVSNLCSYANKFLHSYRRDGALSGRSFGIIALRDE